MVTNAYITQVKLSTVIVFHFCIRLEHLSQILAQCVNSHLLGLRIAENCSPLLVIEHM